MRLKPNWKEILRHAWSVRLLAVAALFSAAEVALPILQPVLSVPTGVFALMSAVAVAGALVCRVLVQVQFGDGE